MRTTHNFITNTTETKNITVDQTVLDWKYNYFAFIPRYRPLTINSSATENYVHFIRFNPPADPDAGLLGFWA